MLTEANDRLHKGLQELSEEKTVAIKTLNIHGKVLRYESTDRDALIAELAAKQLLNLTKAG